MRVRLKQPRLLQLLAGSKLSQNHWALKLGLSRGHWSDIVNGKHPFPSPRTRVRMLETFGLPLDELFEIESGIAPWADTDFRRSISDRYLIDSELGQGGMGAVYLGRDVRHGRTIAVKVISPEAVSGIGVDQFLREIATVAQLHHPNILPLFDSGEAAGHPFYVMPYVRGGSLRARLAERVRLPVGEAVTLAAGVAAALERAHQQRVLHCDVKPENILLDEQHPWVMDFGIARKLHTEVLPWTLRRELDLSAGTPAYVSPEQASGERELDARSDVYSLACVTYEMLTGHTPFEGTSTESVVSKRFFQSPPPMRDFAPEVPPALESAVLAGMALEPSRRPESAAQFAESLTRAAAGASGLVVRTSLAITRTLTALRPRRRAPRIGGILMDGIGRDLVHAWRGLRRAPGFALVVILTLGMAIGANATMFGLADRLLFRAPAGIGHPEQVRRVLVARWIKGLGRAGPSMSYPAFMDFRDRTRSFQHVAAVEEVIYSYGSGASARPAYVTLATGQYFQLLEVQPLLGRLFGEPDDPPGAGRQVAVLSHPFWRSAFGGDRNVVGRTVELGKRQFTVIGVAPEGFTGTELSRVDMWIPMSASSGGPFGDEGWLQSRGSQWLQTIVRLKPGVEDGSATQDATRAYREGHADEKPRDFHQKAEASFAGLTGASLAGTDGSTARVAAWLLGVTVMLLVIACANVANLVLARGLLRRGEIAVRLAMGVSRGRLLRQLLTESFLLAGLGLGLGLVLVRGASGLLRSLLLPGYAWEGNPVDQRVLAVTIVATLLAAITAGLLPLWRGTRTDVAAQLHGANRSTAAHSKKLRTGLLLVQTGLSTALLIGAGLFLKSLTAVRGLDLGFTPGQLAVVTVDLQPQGIRGPEIKAFYEAAVERVRRIPGIQAAGLSIGSPFMGNWAEQVRLPGADSVLPELAGGGPYFFRVGAGGLEALGVRLLRGRLFTEADDRADAAPVVIVSDRMARTLWQGRDAIGQCLMRGGETVKCHTVVGVVADLHRQALEERERPFFLYFIPLKQDTEYGVPQLLLARVTGDPERWTEAIRKELLVVRPDIPYVSIRSYQNIVDGRARSWRLGASMLTVFGVLSLIIAGIGLYGVLSFAVTQRTQELGIRAALGASPGRLMKLILSSGVTTAVVGVVLGTALALALSSRITPLLFHTSAKDVVVYGATGATILLVAVLASWVPGRRATRVEPVRALKAE